MVLSGRHKNINYCIEVLSVRSQLDQTNNIPTTSTHHRLLYALFVGAICLLEVRLITSQTAPGFGSLKKIYRIGGSGWESC